MKKNIFCSTFTLLIFLFNFMLLPSLSVGQNSSIQLKIGPFSEAVLPVGTLGDWYQLSVTMGENIHYVSCGTLGDWYQLSPNFGASLQFAISRQLQIEIQYGYAYYPDGSIDSICFFRSCHWWIFLLVGK